MTLHFKDFTNRRKSWSHFTQHNKPTGKNCSIAQFQLYAHDLKKGVYPELKSSENLPPYTKR